MSAPTAPLERFLIENGYMTLSERRVLSILIHKMLYGATPEDLAKPSITVAEAVEAGMTDDKARAAFARLDGDWVTSTEDAVTLNIPKRPLDKQEKALAKIAARPVKERTPKEVFPVGRLIDLWCKAYEDVFGCKYMVSGGKDGNAAKVLLKSTQLSPDQLVEQAKDAWMHPDEFSCKQAQTLAGFMSRYNNIMAVIGVAKPTAAKTDDTWNPERFYDNLEKQ